MKSTTLCLVAALLVAPSVGQDIHRQAIDYVEVTDSVVLARPPLGSNMTCIATSAGLYFIDAGMNTDIARRFRVDMEKKFGKKTLALLMTHAHIDHFLGMAAFADTEVVAAETGQSLWQRQLTVEFTEQRIEAYSRIFPGFRECIRDAKPFAPAVWVKGEAVIGEGEDRLILTNTGGHSVDSSSVYFPAERVLVAGDLVQVDQYPYFGDPTTDMDCWLGTFDRWLGMDIAAVCAGHGRAVGKEYIRRMSAYFRDLIDTVKKLKEEGVAVEKVPHHPALPEKYWPETKEEPPWWGYAVAMIYQSL